MEVKATRLCEVPSVSQLGNPGVFVKDDMMMSPSVCQDGKPGVCGEKKVASIQGVSSMCSKRDVSGL